MRHEYACILQFSSGSHPPFIPVQVHSTVTTTTANISWTVPVIAYTPENYTVTYNGLELQTELRVSELILGDPTDILATNSKYSVLLENLEEANTYHYTVNAINCNGTTPTDVMNFTTLPDSKISVGGSLFKLIRSVVYTCDRTYGMIKLQVLS